MKTKVLVYIDRKDKSLGMRIASQEEFTQILQKNRMLPLKEQRLFVKDVIADTDGLDVMYIETELPEYRKWNSGQTYRSRIRSNKGHYKFLSIDTLYANGEEGDMDDFVTDNTNVEQIVLEKEMMQQLQAALEAWQPWANDVFRFYIDGRKHKACSYLKAKYGIPEHQARYRIKRFEKFIAEFFEKNYQFLG